MKMFTTHFGRLAKAALLGLTLAAAPNVFAGAGSDSGGSDSGGSDSGGSSDSPKNDRRSNNQNFSAGSEASSTGISEGVVGDSTARGARRYEQPEISDEERKRFILENREPIQVELARSQGEVLAALGALYKHDESEVVRRLAKDLELLTAATDDQFVDMVHGWLLSENR